MLALFCQAFQKYIIYLYISTYDIYFARLFTRLHYSKNIKTDLLSPQTEVGFNHTRQVLHVIRVSITYSLLDRQGN